MAFNNKLINYIFFSLPFCFISGPLLSDLFISSLFLYFIYDSIKNKSIKVYNKKFDLFFIIFCLILIFSVLFISPAPILKQGTSIFYIRFGIFSLMLYYFFLKKENIISFSKLIYFVFILIILDSLIQFYFGKNITGNILIPTRVSSFFGDELIMGSFISKIFPINLIFISFLDIENKKKKLLYLITIIFSFILIFLSGERTSLGMLLFQIFFIFLFLKYNNYKKILYFLIFLVLISSVSLIDRSKNRDIKVFYKIYNHLDRFEHGLKNYIFIKDNKIEIIPSHKGHYITAFRIFEDNVLFGGGIKSFRYYCSEERYKFDSSSCSTHPHNTTLLFMSELGFIGLAIYIFILCFLFFDLIKYFLNKNLRDLNAQAYNRYVIINVGLVSTILPILPNGNFFNNYMSILFFLLMGYYLILRKNLNFNV